MASRLEEMDSLHDFVADFDIPSNNQNPRLQQNLDNILPWNTQRATNLEIRRPISSSSSSSGSALTINDDQSSSRDLLRRFQSQYDRFQRDRRIRRTVNDQSPFIRNTRRNLNI